MTLPQMVLRQLADKLAQVETPAFGKVVFHGEISYLDAAQHKFTVWAHDEETLKG